MAAATKDRPAAEEHPAEGETTEDPVTRHRRIGRERRQRMKALRKTKSTKGLTHAEEKELAKLEEDLGEKPTTGVGRARSSRASGAKGGKAKGGNGKRPAYPEEVREAVRIAKKARGTSSGAPGPKQHVLVREAIGDRDPLAVVGMSERSLRDAASGKMSTEKLRAQEGLRELGGRIDDPFCKGRNLASMLAAIVEQRKAAS